MTGYQPFNSFLFRTPYFSFSALPDFEKQLDETVFKEMLQVATPDLSEGMDKDIEKAQHSTYRYYQRACTRPTPFGLFAGCSVGTIGDHTKIQLLGHKTYKRVTRLDMYYICALTQQIERDRNIRKQLCYYANSSIYLVGNHFRYVEYHYLKTIRMHQIAQIENSEYIQKILSLAKIGARFSELVATLVDDEITTEDAVEFVHELIDTQVLVSELEPAVTNIQPLTTLIAKLTKLQDTDKQTISILSEIDALLFAIDQQPIGHTVNIYPAIVQNIEKTKIENEIKYLFQSDLFKPAQHATVSRNLIRDIQQALIFLNKITTTFSQTNLSQFKEKFIKRYEEREMSMLFVLDNELGIGYAENTSGDISPLVDDLVIPREHSPSNITLTSFQSTLLKKYQKALQKGEKIIYLTDEDIKGVEVVWDDLPLTFCLFCKILQDDDLGRSVYIRSVGGQSAANLLGRFCHLDEQILNHALAITEKESQMNSDVIFAEIIHIPDSRIGNILLRPVLRSYEISYLAKSGVSKEFEIRPDDLYVSVKNNRIMLRSKRLNKEIIPQMSTAHNYSGANSMPVYHFLCDMQHQNGRTGLGLYWNETIQHFDYLPRVVYKNCILSQSCWTVYGNETKDFAGIKDDDELLQKIKGWRDWRNIPDKVLLADGDNELYIDLNNPLSIRAWLSVVKNRQAFKLVEFLFDPTTAVVSGPEGAFTNEFMFAFYREEESKN